MLMLTTLPLSTAMPAMKLESLQLFMNFKRQKESIELLTEEEIPVYGCFGTAVTVIGKHQGKP